MIQNIRSFTLAPVRIDDIATDHALPDYDLDEVRVVTGRDELKAMFHPLRGTILDLVLERAASVKELAEAVGRPPSSVAYHVGVLVDAGMLEVVRTRRVRAVEERFYGRTARSFTVGLVGPEQIPVIPNLLADATRESAPALKNDDLRAVHRHARIPHDRVAEFWEEVMDMATRFSAERREGDTTYAFVAGLYPVDFPRLPEPESRSHRDQAR
jgi:DNA-binding transcriptional ArsR family regulator